MHTGNVCQPTSYSLKFIVIFVASTIFIQMFLFICLENIFHCIHSVVWIYFCNWLCEVRILFYPWTIISSCQIIEFESEIQHCITSPGRNNWCSCTVVLIIFIMIPKADFILDANIKSLNNCTSSFWVTKLFMQPLFFLLSSNFLLNCQDLRVKYRLSHAPV